MRTIATAAALLAAFGAAPALAQDFTSGDPEAGQSVFRQCQACHAVGEGAVNKVGPQLNDLFGRVPGSVADYNYSPAMVEFGQDHVWTVETLAAFLAAPRQVVKGTKMPFAGLRKEEDVANVLAYLAQFDENGMQAE